MKINYDLNRTMKAFPKRSVKPMLGDFIGVLILGLFVSVVAYMIILGATNDLSVIKQVNQHYQGGK